MCLSLLLLILTFEAFTTTSFFIIRLLRLPLDDTCDVELLFLWLEVNSFCLQAPDRCYDLTRLKMFNNVAICGITHSCHLILIWELWKKGVLTLNVFANQIKGKDSSDSLSKVIGISRNSQTHLPTELKTNFVAKVKLVCKMIVKIGFVK